MRRSAAAVALFAFALVLVASALASGVHRQAPTKLTIWVGWSAGKELTTFKAVAAEYDKNHPEVTVKVVGGIDDNKIVAAIRSGTAPDVVSSFNSYNVGNYCGSGGWVDLDRSSRRTTSTRRSSRRRRGTTRSTGQALRAAAARRRLRPLLQQEAVREGRDQEPAEDDV